MQNDDRVTFKDVIIAKLWMRGKRQGRVLDPKLKSEIDARGEMHIWRIVRILELFGQRERGEGFNDKSPAPRP